MTKMLPRAAFLLFILLVLTLIGAPADAAKTDVLELMNGDRITGEIKKMERGQLKYSTDGMSTVYIEWKDVASIQSVHRFRVRLDDGTFYYGSLGVSSDSLAVVVVTANDSILLQSEDVVGITPIYESFWSRMDGSLSLGFNYTQAINIGQLAFDYRNSYQAQKNFLEFRWKLNITGQQDKNLSRYQDLSLTYERELRKPRWYTSGGLGFQQNDEQGIAGRVLATTGMGRRMVQTNHELWTSLAGISVNAEKSSGTDSTTLNLEGVITTGFQYFRYDSPKSDISSNLTVLPGLTTWGRVRVNFDISLRHELISDFFVDLTLWDNYDTDPPSEGAHKNDWAITTSIGWSY